MLSLTIDALPLRCRGQAAYEEPFGGLIPGARGASVGADIEAVIVFGSVARGEASEGSDIDLAVVSDILRDGFAIIGSVPRTTDGAT